MRRWVTSEPYRSIVRALVQARLAQGLSQRELARRLAKPPSFVAKIEQGERRVDVLEFIAIARCLGIQPADLFAAIENGLPESFDI